MVTDALFRCSARRQATAFHNNQSEDVYLYEFHFPYQVLPTFHFAEIIYLWQQPPVLMPVHHAHHQNMIERWTEFGIDGDPNSWKWWKANWAPYNPSSQSRMRLDLVFKMEYQTDDPGCDIFDSIESTRYPIDINALLNTQYQIIDPLFNTFGFMLEFIAGIQLLQ